MGMFNARTRLPATRELSRREYPKRSVTQPWRLRRRPRHPDARWRRYRRAAYHRACVRPRLKRRRPFPRVWANTLRPKAGEQLSRQQAQGGERLFSWLTRGKTFAKQKGRAIRAALPIPLPVRANDYFAAGASAAAGEADVSAAGAISEAEASAGAISAGAASEAASVSAGFGWQAATDRAATAAAAIRAERTILEVMDPDPLFLTLEGKELYLRPPRTHTYFG